MRMVRETFLEFWPPALTAHAFPHVTIALRADEIAALQRCHRTGSDAAGDLENLAVRAAMKADGKPFFMRLGYGSWAASQLAKFASLRIDDAETALAVLSLRDLRLAEISRRWAHGYEQKLYVRPFVPPKERTEVRVQVMGNNVSGAWHRHAPAQLCTAPDLAHVCVAHLPERSNCFIDFICVGGRWFLSDINPLIGGVERRVPAQGQAAVSLRARP